MKFSDQLIKWYELNKRELPWRNTKDPYYIWLSEIILQQTRVDQGMAYYNKFIKHYPNIKLLAKASEDSILKDWQGLGYYSRARNLHETAKQVVKEYDGKFPTEYEKILKLKGIGTYTAAAISSFAFNQPYAVVDGNVFRVLSRVYGIKTPIDSGKGKKEFIALAQELMDKNYPATYNQAIMEFGAVQCKPLSPKCENCPLVESCFAYRKKQIKELPVKSKKLAVKNRFFEYFHVSYKNQFFLRKRTGKDIWKNMYDFPIIETEMHDEEKNVLKGKAFKKLFQKKPTIREISPVYKHVLSHQYIYARFWKIDLKNKNDFNLQDDFILVNKGNLERYAVPKLIDNFLKNQALS